MPPSEPYSHWMENEPQIIYGILFVALLILLIIGILIYHFREYDKKRVQEERKRAEKNRIKKHEQELAARKEKECRLAREKARQQHLKTIEEDRIRNSKIKAQCENNIFKKGDPEYVSNGEYVIDGKLYVSVWKFKIKNNILPNENSINGMESQYHASNVSRYYSCVPDFSGYDTVKIFPPDELGWHYLSRKP